MNKVKFNDLVRQHAPLRADLSAAFERVMDHHEFIQGREVAQFEEAWAKYTGAKHAIGCSNGTDAILLPMLALGIGAGDEVITTPYTFFATVEAIVSVGAKPILVDVDSASGLLDASKIEAAVTSRTKAIIPVHMYGQSADMTAILAVADRLGLKVIEDAAQAHDSHWKGKHAGNWGIAGTFSFFPGKNLGALGDAGAIVSNDDELAKEMRSLRDHGRLSKYEHRKFGWNMRMDGLQAAALNVKLPHLDRWTERRRAIAEIYDAGLSDVKGLTPTTIAADAKTCHHLYVIRHADRAGLAKRLGELGIETGVHYPMCAHQQPAWIEKFGKQSFPISEHWAAHCLSLPMFGDLSEEEAHRVVEAVKSAV